MKSATFKLFVIALAVMLCQAIAFADQVPFTWTTSGAWTGDRNTLNFANASTQTGTSSPAGILNGIYLGQFSMQGTLLDSENPTGNFTLTVNFTVPGGVAGDNTYSATWGADYNFFSEDSATVTFTEITNHLAFTSLGGVPGTGGFDLAIANPSITFSGLSTGETNRVDLRGNITGATFTPTVPEPAAIVLFGTMLLGVGIWRKSKA